MLIPNPLRSDWKLFDLVKRTLPLAAIALGGASFGTEKPLEGCDSVLWYKQPASKWMEALPVGNGRFGAMVFGDPNHERIQLNEDSLWPAADGWGDPEGTPVDLERVRELLKVGKHVQADALFVEKFLNKKISKSHQTLGDLWIDFGDGEYSDYRRSLDLGEAISKVEYKKGGVEITQEVIASNPDDGIIIRYRAIGGRGIDAKITMTRPDDKGFKTARSFVDNGDLVMQGEVTQRGGRFQSVNKPVLNGVKFDTRLAVRQVGGELLWGKDFLELKGVREATLYLVCNTDFNGHDYKVKSRRQLLDLAGKSYDELLGSHISDHRSLYDVMDLQLGNEENLNTLPTDERLRRVKDGAVDLGLENMLFNYGRYLLIASSRVGANPANLQGLWNDNIQAPWNSDYHLNINLQMNYWLANQTGLDELNYPLFELIDRLVENGKESASKTFGCRGTFIPHATDIWAPTWLRSSTAYWGGSFGAGGWLMQHYWNHYLFTQDQAFLRERAFPAMLEVCKFYSDWLIVDPVDGKLVSAPSSSPENSFYTKDGERAALVMGSAKDQQVIYEAFIHFLEAAEILGVSNDWTETIAYQLDRLRAGVRIGQDGRILEWDREYPEFEPGHRHMSNLYAFHPGDQITHRETPDWVEAARKTMEFRIENGGGYTGWSRAWLVNLQARFLDGEKARENIQALFRDSMADNLFDLHPPFQIDGNFGYTSGVCEMLLQSHEEGLVRILPALPKEWSSGSVRGIKARGNIVFDFRWEDGDVVSLSCSSPFAQTIELLVNGTIKNIRLKDGEPLQVF